MKYLLFLLLIPVLGYSQYSDTLFSSYPENNGFIAYIIEEKVGFIKPNHEVIPAIYDEVGDFNEGFCPVRIDDFWGAINEEGLVVIPIEYDLIYYFFNGHTIGAKDDTYYLIDDTGKIKTDVPYQNIFPSENDSIYFVVYEDKYGMINQNNEIVIPIQYEYLLDSGEGKLAFLENGLIGIMTYSGELISEAKYKDMTAFECGLAYVWKSETERVEINGEGKEGVYSTLKEEHYKLPNLPNSLFKFEIYVEDEEGYRTTHFGLQNLDGKVVLPPDYDFIGHFNEGHAVVAKNELIGLIDSTGQVKIPLKYYGGVYELFSEGLLPVMDVKTGKFGYVNAKDEVIVPFQYDWASSFSEGLGVVYIHNEKEDFGFYINRKNKRFFYKKFDYVEEFKDGLAVAVKNEKYGIINKKGKKVIPFEYDYLQGFTGDLTVARRNDKVGLINLKNELVVDLYYDYIENYESNYQIVVGKGKIMNYTFALMDRKGNELTPFKYLDIEPVADGEFYRVMTIDSYDEEGWGTQTYGYLDKTGFEVVPPIYDFAFLINEREACVSLGQEKFRIELETRE